MLNHDTVSVVIPCYNAGPLLKTAIESALSQSLSPLEIIVIDDGSTDNSAAIAQSFGNLVTVFSQKNCGVSAARNKGIDIAAGKWIAFLDADDVWAPDKLEKQIGFLPHCPPDIVCVYSNWVEDLGGTVAPVSRPDYANHSRYQVDMLLDWCVLTSTALVLSAAARQTRFYEHIRTGEDAIFFLELRMKGSIRRIELPLAIYRVPFQRGSVNDDALCHSITNHLRWLNENISRYDLESQTLLKKGLAQNLSGAYSRCLYNKNKEIRTTIEKILHDLNLSKFQLPWQMKNTLAATTVRCVRGFLSTKIKNNLSLTVGWRKVKQAIGAISVQLGAPGILKKIGFKEY